MGLSWRQGPLSPRRVGRFLVPDPVPDRLLYAEPRRRRVRFGGTRIAGKVGVYLDGIQLEPGQIVISHRAGDRGHARRDAIAGGPEKPRPRRRAS
jgi:hypothetical protein